MGGWRTVRSLHNHFFLLFFPEWFKGTVVSLSSGIEHWKGENPLQFLIGSEMPQFNYLKKDII